MDQLPQSSVFPNPMQVAQAIGNYYRCLIENGVPRHDALELSKDVQRLILRPTSTLQEPDHLTGGPTP